MPDTLAPKKTMTQRELDNKLTPISEKVKEGPLVTGEIVKDYLFKPLPLLQDERISVKTKEQQQTQASAKEGLVKRPEVEDTGDIENVSTVQQGEVKPTLAARPVMYAADGMDNKEINNPIVVGEKGPEMLVPTGNGRFSILPNDVVNGLMEKTKTPTPELSSTVSIMQVPEIDTGNLVSEDPNVEDQYEDSFSKPLLKSKLANRDTATQSIYNYNEDIPSVGGIVDNNFDSMIFPKIENNKSLPKNTDMTDISGAIRDSYKHGYTAGYFSLSQGRNTAEFIGSDLQEKAIAALDIPDNASMLFARGIGRDTRSDRNQDIIMDAYMDINNNKVGISIADQARKNLKFTPNEKLSGANLIAAEKEFQKLYNKNFINTVEKYEGDYKTTYPGYESVPTNKELKDLLYGKGSGTIKNRITSFFKDDFRDDKIPEQIIRYNPKMIDKYKKDQQENFRETSRGNPDTFTEM